MKKIITLIFTILSICSISAQKLYMCDFNHLVDDISATIHQVKDANGVPCALIKIWTPATSPYFEGPILKVIDKDGEYWIYVATETTYLTIKSKDYPPVRAEFPSVQSNNTYELLCCKYDQRPLQRGLTPQWQAGISLSTKRVLQRFIDNMVAVEGGTFRMGAQSSNSSSANYDSGADRDEFPVHSVRLSDYHIGKYEVTQEEWEAVMGNNPSYFKGENKPVECVSWNDCQEFIKKLNELTGLQFRLLTEAEWEYAARGGNKSRGYKYSGSNVIGDVAWYWDNSSRTTHQVGTKRPNELGLYDMSGNVREWCSDRYSSIYYSSSPVNNPTGPVMGSGHVARGGGWHCDAARCRVANRGYDYLDYRYINIGFRLAHSLK